jgi:hypothetical protein
MHRPFIRMAEALGETARLAESVRQAAQETTRPGSITPA